MANCPHCKKPHSQYYRCDEQKAAELRNPAPAPSPMAKGVAKDMAKAPNTYRYRDRERRRDYMRRYMRGYGCKRCRVPEGYFGAH